MTAEQQTTQNEQTQRLLDLLTVLYGGNLSSLDPNTFASMVLWISQRTGVAFISPEEFQSRLVQIPPDEMEKLIAHLKSIQKDARP
jgi:hypothetical protein